VSANRSKWPILVRLGLWGLQSRASAWAYFWVCAVIALGSIAAGILIDSRAFIGAPIVFSAWWRYASIRRACE
jgi:hypothetical protein